MTLSRVAHRRRLVAQIAGLIVIGILVLAQPFSALAQTPPTVSGISFSPSTLASGGTSQLTITFSNPNAAVATLTQPSGIQTQITDTLPPGMTVAKGAAPGGTCTGGTVTANAGSKSVTWASVGENLGTIPATGSCTIQVSVTAASGPSKTYYTNTIPANALQTTVIINGIVTGFSSPTAASATLTVQAPVKVPNVIGLTQAAAAASLQAAGLVVAAVNHLANAAPYGTVFLETPAATSSLPAGSGVSISVSTGPHGPNGATTVSNALNPLPSSLTPGQQSVAGAFQRVCAALQTPGTTLTPPQQNLLANCNAILATYGGGANSANLPATLNAISGMQSTAMQQAGVQFAGLQFASVGGRLAQLRAGASGVSLAGLDLGTPTSAAVGDLVAVLKDVLGVKELIGGGAGDAASTPSRLGFFVNGNLRRGSQDATANVTGFDFRSNGITAGIDYRFTNHLIFGLAAGHISGTTDFVDSSGRQDSRSNSGSLYGTYYNEAFYVDLIGSYAHISYDAARTTSFAISSSSPVSPSNCVSVDCSIDTQGDTGAKQYSLAANAGYSFNRQAFVFGPDVAVNYTRINVNGFTETDPQTTGMGLTFDSQTGQSLLIKAGGHLSYAIKTGIAVILPEARIHYIHEFKNDQEVMTAHFSQDPTIGTPTGPVSNFVVFTDQPKRDYFDYAAGFSAQFAYGISAFAEYNALGAAGNVHAHDFAFGIRFQPLSR